MLDEVRERTGRAHAEVERLLEQREALPRESPDRGRIDEQVQQLVSAWARSMEALGLEVKGLWLVDFDNGSGYYCWKWPEERLEHFHGYDDGFEGRLRIQ